MKTVILKVQKLSGFGKAFGLINKNKAKSIFFATRFGIHTFGVKFPIDVLILDNNYEVKTSKEKMMPNKILIWNPKFKNILELPEGTINSKRIKVGDTLKLETFN